MSRLLQEVKPPVYSEVGDEPTTGLNLTPRGRETEMILSFTLSMPSNNSWDGKWSGDKDLFVVLRSFRGKRGEAKANEILTNGYYSYSFGDGWRASIEVQEETAQSATKLRKRSKGFSGYDWMITEIIEHGRIRSYEERCPKQAV